MALEQAAAAHRAAAEADERARVLVLAALGDAPLRLPAPRTAEPRIVSLKDAARVAKQSPRALKAWARRHDLGWRLPTGRWVVDLVRLEAFLTRDDAS